MIYRLQILYCYKVPLIYGKSNVFHRHADILYSIFRYKRMIEQQNTA